jgi:hypothetical protein
MNLQPFSTFLRGQNTWQLQMTSQSWWEMVQHLPAHGTQLILDNGDHMGIILSRNMSHLISMTRWEVFSSWQYKDLGGFHVSTVHWWWCQDPWRQASAVHWTDFASWTLTFNHVILFPLVLMHTFCCTACSQLLVFSHVPTCISLTVLEWVSFKQASCRSVLPLCSLLGQPYSSYVNPYF